MNKKKLYKSSQDKKLCGVCGGIAEYFDVDSTVIRLAWVVFTLLGGSGLLAYIIAAIIMKDDPGYIDMQ
jgi:phage shock protein PspC (stress-responsive transcriptional regulator)